MLKTLQLQNFRNYSKRTFKFSSNATLIVGPNAVGKTNVLEAIYLLGVGRSFRAENERELICADAQKFRESRNLSESVNWLIGGTQGGDGKVAGIYGKTEGQELEIVWDTRDRFQKLYKINGVGRRQVDFVGNLRAVLFSPTDIEIVSDSPSIRRKYLDLVLTQVFKEYRVATHVYERALRQRNRLLRRIRDEGVSPEQLDYWDELLIMNGKIIHDRRKGYLSYLTNLPNLLFSISLIYDHSIISEERLSKYASEEVAAATTLVGPHRDDFKILNRGREVRLFGSRGEQRMATFELKLGELEFIKQATRESPLLLLDDIFSELDHSNRHLLLRVIPKQQTIMTTTDLHLVEAGYLKHTDVIELK